jgi:Poly (ADP-ribose) glycohydrolase (PARG), helical domain
LSFAHGVKGCTKAGGLIKYFDDNEEENLIFFSDGGVFQGDIHEFHSSLSQHVFFKGICTLAQQLPTLIQRIPILATGVDAHLRMNQLQIASLLANSFLCTFPDQLVRVMKQKLSYLSSFVLSRAILATLT